MQAKTHALSKGIKALFSRAKTEKGLVIFAFFLLVSDAIFHVIVPAVMGYVVDDLISEPKNFVQNKLPWMSAGVIAVSLIFYLVAFGWHYISTKLVRIVTIRFQMDLYQHLQRLSSDFYQRNKIGEIASRLTTDIQTGIAPMFTLLLCFAWAMAVLLPSLISIALIHHSIFLIFISVCALFVLINRWIAPKIRALNRATQDEMGMINARITETISANQLIKSFCWEKRAIDDLKTANSSFLNKALKAQWFTTLFSDINNCFIVVLSPMLILLGGSIVVAHGAISVGMLVATFGYWRAASGPINMILSSITQWYTSLASLDRVLDFFEETPLVEDRPGAKALKVDKGRIEFRHVDFHYPGEEDGKVIENFCLDIQAKSQVALVGESGAGKSTLAQLLLRFFDPVSGSIHIDGQNLNEVTQHSLRNQIGFVMQETILLSSSLRDNLLIAKPDASEEELISALKAAEAWEFAQSLPDGLNTVLGERGARLSGGQKQRLSIARVFLKNPPIVVFDEATSALDAVTEKSIQASMDKLLAGRTAVIIAHRLSTIIACDRIILMNQGRIRDMGKHRELMGQSKDYQALCEAQRLDL